MATARAVRPPHVIAANTTTAIATVRFLTRTILARSMNGIANSATMARVGRIKVPTNSSGPSNTFSIWNRNRKYHSGRGVKCVSVGSATCPSGTRAKIAMPTSTQNQRNVATVSL